MHEIAKVLRKAGARRIYAAVAARSSPPGKHGQPESIADEEPEPAIGGPGAALP